MSVSVKTAGRWFVAKLVEQAVRIQLSANFLTINSLKKMKIKKKRLGMSQEAVHCVLTKTIFRNIVYGLAP